MRLVSSTHRDRGRNHSFDTRVASRAMRTWRSFMDKKIAGLLGAVAALGTLGAAQASPAPAPDPSDALKANSYAELLEQIQHAEHVLQAHDEQAHEKLDQPKVQVAQWSQHPHHHHPHGY